MNRLTAEVAEVAEFGRVNQLTEAVIGAAIDVHRTLGPGLLEHNAVLVEVKSVEVLAPIHDAQLLTYLRLGGWTAALLINFNVRLLKQGIRRRVLNLEEQASF